MRSFIVVTLFVAALASAAWNDHTETRDMQLDADGIRMLEIDAGAGSMDVKGVSGVDSIVVGATIVVSGSSEDKAAKLIDRKMKLSLESHGDRALLVSDFESGVFGRRPDARIDLEITVPAGIALRIDDGSGSIDIADVAADVAIDDGSGSIDVRNVAGVIIDDGSGSIDVAEAAGDVSITDGSGSISVRSVGGSVTIDDGSGSIRVNDVEKDLVIVDDGSGSQSFTNIKGAIDQDS